MELDTQAVLAVFVAFLVAAIPGAVLVTKAVDLVRELFDSEHRAPPWSWNILAFVFGVGMCLGWGFNPFASLVHAIPALATDARVDGVAGQVISGLAIGAMGGFWHEKLAQWNSIRYLNKSTTQSISES